MLTVNKRCPPQTALETESRIELPAPSGLRDLPALELPPPSGLRALPRSHVDPLSRFGTESKAVTAVLLGLVSLPAAAMFVANPSPAAAQGIRLDAAEAESIASTVIHTAARSEDPRVQELMDKLERLIDRRFDGDVASAFAHYAGGDQQVSKDELRTLLGDAGVGNFITRGAWVDGIMERLDKAPNGNGNNRISWQEFQRVVSANT